MSYKDFIEGLSLKHFSAGEFLSQSKRVRNGVQNSLPPESKWEAIVETAWIADLARRQLGFPLTITSAYRSPDYNSAVGGAVRSQHLANTALDLIPKNGKVEELYHQLICMRQGGAFKGGIGRYNAFVHLDTRGSNATWGTW